MIEPLRPIKVNRTGRVTKGPNDGVVGNVVGADWLKKIVKIENSEGAVITVPWDAVEQFI